MHSILLEHSILWDHSHWPWNSATAMLLPFAEGVTPEMPYCLVITAGVTLYGCAARAARRVFGGSGRPWLTGQSERIGRERKFGGGG